MRTVLISLMIANAAVGFCQAPKASADGSASQVWEIPFASEGNTISLNVQNNSSLEAKNVSVEFTDPPTWLEFKNTTSMIKTIPAKGSGEAGFTFSADKKAPVGKDTTLTAVISTSDGQRWTKEITVTIAPPKDYRLYSNFPNPFNPSTKIAFELPKTSHVTLVIYDVIGRQVAQVADGEFPAGYNELTWNGTNRNGAHVSSGVYFYRITAGNWNKVMKMLSLK